jgi:putative ABC transport system permease protein
VNEKLHKTSRRGERLLRFFLSSEDAESIAGDLEENLHDLSSTRSSLRAKGWYWLQVVKAALSAISVWFFWHLSMLRTYTRLTWRNIRRQKIYSLISIAGLAVGMAVCILILLWVRYERSYDRFHGNINELHRVILNSEDGRFHDPATVGLIAGYLEENYPDILLASNLGETEFKLTHRRKTFIADGLLVNPGFLEMFTFPLKEGDPQTAFNEPDAVVITEDLALKLIGEGEVLGKTIWVEDRAPFKISGVVANIPRNSSIQFDYLLPYLTMRSNRDQWNWRDTKESYVLLQQGISHLEVNKKIVNVFNDHNRGKEIQNLSLQPMTRVHLFRPGGGGLITYVYLFSVMAVVVLLIACINFMNLSTACSEKRFKEIGIKKVVGSSRAQLIKQFLSEYMLLSFLALLLALILVQFTLPLVSTLVGQPLELKLSVDVVAVFLGIAVCTGFFSGAFPAFLLSSFDAVTVIKGQFPFFGRAGLRKLMVVMQFGLSIVFIIGALALSKQMDYVRNKDLGFSQEHVVVVPVRGRAITMKLPAVKERLLKEPEIKNVTGSSFDMIHWNSSMGTSWFDGVEERTCNTGCAWVDFDYIDTMKIDLVAGRFFSHEFPSDREDAYVLNEAAVEALGIKDPIGQKIIRGKGANWADPGVIVGVVKDYHVQSLHRQLHPFILVLSSSAGLSKLLIRIAPDDIPQTLVSIEKAIQEVIPNYPVTIRFLDEMLNDMYKYEYITGKIINYITVLAIFISCLGLLGLASFSVERRTKEIGIRKVLGSTASGITILFMRDFVKWVILANFFAWPLAYYALNRWMQRFVYRTELSWYIFLLSGFIAVIVALATVYFHSFRAAQANPVESLRYE